MKDEVIIIEEGSVWESLTTPKRRVQIDKWDRGGSSGLEYAAWGAWELVAGQSGNYIKISTDHLIGTYRRIS